MEAIKKKIAALKQEMDAANEKVEANEAKARSENFRADKLNDDVRDLQKKLAQLERDYGITKTNLEQSTADLEQCEKSWSKVRKDTCYIDLRKSILCNWRMMLIGRARSNYVDQKGTRDRGNVNEEGRVASFSSIETCTCDRTCGRCSKVYITFIIFTEMLLISDK